MSLVNQIMKGTGNMRYFYHYGYHHVTMLKDYYRDYKPTIYNNHISDEVLSFDNWHSTEQLIEVSEETYKLICEDEERIKEVDNVPYWHRPVAFKEIPEGKILRKKIWKRN
jgi:hypothetical protein